MIGYRRIVNGRRYNKIFIPDDKSFPIDRDFREFDYTRQTHDAWHKSRIKNTYYNAMVGKINNYK